MSGLKIPDTVRKAVVRLANGQRTVHKEIMLRTGDTVPVASDTRFSSDIRFSYRNLEQSTTSGHRGPITELFQRTFRHCTDHRFSVDIPVRLYPLKKIPTEGSEVTEEDNSDEESPQD
ncbi:hypothetical protein BaRGS_00031573 [Batillaria attramentaria]|uniref:Uncharacterized protein n=1 Tax=Batillaria attramentaria TaxID=370345 RepID=A0ABD0JQ41_9CAEN